MNFRILLIGVMVFLFVHNILSQESFFNFDRLNDMSLHYFEDQNTYWYAGKHYWVRNKADYTYFRFEFDGQNIVLKVSKSDEYKKDGLGKRYGENYKADRSTMKVLFKLADGKMIKTAESIPTKQKTVICANQGVKKNLINSVGGVTEVNMFYHARFALSREQLANINKVGFETFEIVFGQEPPFVYDFDNTKKRNKYIEEELSKLLKMLDNELAETEFIAHKFRPNPCTVKDFNYQDINVDEYNSIFKEYVLDLAHKGLNCPKSKVEFSFELTDEQKIKNIRIPKVFKKIYGDECIIGLKENIENLEGKINSATNENGEFEPLFFHSLNGVQKVIFRLVTHLK